VSRAAAAALVLLLCAPAGEARTRTYAIIVAQNRSLDPAVKPLQFADDDGVKTWELFSLYTSRASLFVVPDADTARLHPQAARRAEVPERAAILARLERYNAMMARDLARGDEPELFFVYAGHGDIDAQGQGYINIHDGRLTRADLYREVIAASKARFVHVIIDACKSYFMVRSRGRRPWKDDAAPSAGASEARLRAFLLAERLESYPRAGVIVATSGDQDAHEWARYRGGILSHELRSALAGAADINGDGRVEYSELLAFLAAANARVRHPQARIDVFSRPPAANRSRALVDQRRASGRARFLRFGPGLSGRFYIEDDRGLRYADLNKEAAASFDVAVSRERSYYVRRNEVEEVEIRPSRRRVDLGELRWTPVALSARGAVDQSFRSDLFRVPFGPLFYEGYVAKSGDVPVELGASSAPERGADFPRHRLAVGMSFSGSPAGDSGPSYAADLRYGYRLRRWFDVGVAVQVGHGGADRQSLTRTALLGAAGATWRPWARAAFRFDAAFGWQALHGTVDLPGGRFTGSEPRGFRLEAGAGIELQVSAAIGLWLRGGLALDGVYPADASASTTPSANASLSVLFSW
jgi:hypothetical protein